jgi:DNA-binding response OmpR family regulator
MRICLLGGTTANHPEWTRRLERVGAEVCAQLRAPAQEAIVLLTPETGSAPRQVRELREQCPMAALLVLTDADLPLRVRLLEEGADDLLPTRTPPEEILSRLAALADLGPEAGPWTEVGDLRLGPSRVAVYLEERHLDLGEHAYRVLRKLAESAPQSASREALMNAGWGEPIEDNRLDAQIRRLRSALAQAASPRIETVRGLGYRLQG